jgi:hypothetical protein
MRRFILILAVLASASATAGPAAPPAQTQTIQQCYFVPIRDPDNSCTSCANTCLGSGYRCCIIVAG